MTRTHSFTGLRAGQFDGGVEGNALTRERVGSVVMFESRPGMPRSRYQARPVEQFPMRQLFIPRTSKNFNAQGVDGFHKSPQRNEKPDCSRAFVSNFTIAKTFASHVKTYACGDSSCETKRSKFETVSAVK